MNLRIYNYNNYYNRIVKILNTTDEEYSNYIFEIEKANFIPNDNITTSHSFGNYLTPYNGGGDYLVVTDEENNIVSRWFIMEAVRLTGGQWRLDLRRDLMADYHEQIINAPCFIEKGIALDNDPAIYNSEDIEFNQIKTWERPLKDDTGCAWIVGYFDRGQNLSANVPSQSAYDIVVNTPLQEWDFYKYVNTVTPILDSIKYYCSFAYYWHGTEFPLTKNHARASLYSVINNDVSLVRDESGIYGTFESVSNFDVFTSSTKTINTTLTPNNDIRSIYKDWSEGPAEYIKKSTVESAFNSVGFSTLKENLRTLVNFVDESEDLLKFNNKRIRFTNTNGTYSYYSINVNYSTDSTAKYIENGISYKYINRDLTSLGNEPNDALNDSLKKISANSKEDRFHGLNGFYISIGYKPVKITLTEISGAETKVDFANTDRYHTLDAPYDMFAIPYPDEDVNTMVINNTGGDVPGITNKYAGWTCYRKVAMDIAQALNTKYGGETNPYLYDLQLLPYCPCSEIITTDDFGRVSLDLDSNTHLFVPILNSSNVPVSVVLFASRSSFTLDIDWPGTPKFITNKKIENQTDVYRLVSPNYNGQFEFNLAKNNIDGFKLRFNVDCTYRPYNPYIHINPVFNGLYGQDFNDARGLICGGDFSLPLMTSAWQTYQRSNKYYQDIFDREVQNLEVNNSVAKGREIQNMIFSTISGAANGAVSGAMNPYTAIAGGIIGGGKNLLTSGLEFQRGETLRSEALDYKQDMFGYNLATIRALPNSLAKTTAFTYNNKIYPILEYYTCTDKEKEAFANKIAYNGMTIMRIATINDYIGLQWSYKDIQSKNYIKGRIIRLDNLNDDTHIANEIANEVFKGGYYE